MEHGDEAKGDHHDGHRSHRRGMYLRFGAMIATAMVVMYAVMFVGSWEWSHVRLSASRIFMALTMGGTMGLVMLAWMLNMYKSATANVIVVIASLVLFGVGTFLDRSQTTVGDVAFQNAMIPHHSLAITRSERAQIEDVRVCELAIEISEAQRREILEMSWLVEDIRANGIAATAEEAAARPVPDFDRPAERDCPAAWTTLRREVGVLRHHLALAVGREGMGVGRALARGSFVSARRGPALRAAAAATDASAPAPVLPVSRRPHAPTPTARSRCPAPRCRSGRRR